MSFQQSRTRDQHGWDEEAWECFFRREDARMAKFGELFTTLADHPNREQVIMCEMGLPDLADACRQAHGDCTDCSRHTDCDVTDMRRLFEWPDDMANDPDSDDLLACFEEVKRLPVYRKADRFAVIVQRYFSLRRDRVDGTRCAAGQGRCKAVNDPAAALVDSAAMVPAQVAGGHGIGYEDDCICGNIANCKRALCNATRCAQTLAEMSLPKRDAARLLAAANEVCITLAGWIEELRSRAHG